MAEMTPEEMNNEVLECARYGEDEDLQALLNAGADVNFADVGGSTALHKAAANGHEGCLKVLHTFGAKFTKNDQGNTPAHWAAQNGKSAALKFLVENFQVDVLEKNDQGRSILTEAFESKDTDSISVCLSHESASEERLIPEPKEGETATVDIQMQTDEGDAAETSVESQEGDVTHAVTHTMQFGPEVRIRVRELPITRADNPFGTDTAPEDDTTGLSVWPASILLGQWVAKLARENALPNMQNKTVLELGAGCGLPALVAGTVPIHPYLYVSLTILCALHCSSRVAPPCGVRVGHPRAHAAQRRT